VGDFVYIQFLVLFLFALFDYEPQVWVGRGFGTWRSIKYSVALALRHTKYLDLGAKVSEYFMNRQVLSMGKINRSRRSDRKNFGGGNSTPPTNPTSGIMKTKKNKKNTACYRWYRYGGIDRE